MHIFHLHHPSLFPLYQLFFYELQQLLLREITFSSHLFIPLLPLFLIIRIIKLPRASFLDH